MLETDAEQFDCTTCALAKAQADLQPENVEAWHVFHAVAKRFVSDFGLAAEVMRPVLRDLEPEDAMDLMERLSVIYDVLYPPPPEPNT